MSTRRTSTGSAPKPKSYIVKLSLILSHIFEEDAGTAMTDARHTDNAGKGVLAIWHDIDADQEADVIEWYNREHHAERVGTLGFRRSRRHVAVEGTPKYFIFYETDSAQVLSSAPYLERANAPSDWSRRSMPHFRNNFRTVCHVTWRSSGPDGGHVATFRLSPNVEDVDALRARLTALVAGRVLKERGMLKAQLWEAEAGASAIPTGDKALRDKPDLHSKWALIVSGVSQQALRAAVAAHLSDEALAALGFAPGSALGFYSLQAALEKDHLAAVG